MLTDYEIIDAMFLREEKDAIHQEMLQEQQHEQLMRTDIDYFFEHTGFDQLKEDYDKLHKLMWDYGYCESLKDYL